MTREAHLGLFAGDPPEYRFCNPGWSAARRALSLESLLEQARAIDPAECGRVTFGHMPLAHPEFATLVRECRARGLSGLTLETDGPPLAAATEALVAQGFETVFVFAGGARRRVHEAVMRDAGFAETLEGIRRAAASPMALYVVVPVLRWTADDLVPLLEYLTMMEERPTGFLLQVPEVRSVPSSMRALLLSHAEQARLAARVFAACAREKIEYGFFRKRGLLPCATEGALDRFGTVFFERMHVLKHRRDDPDDTFVRVAGCAECSLEQSCPGADLAYIEEHGEHGLRPVPLEVSMDWRLKPINRLETRGLKSVSAFDNDADHNGRSLLRINGHCNMSCSFCFIDRSVPDLPTDVLRRSIDALASQQLDHIVLSGGEPTLHPDLPGLIAHARSHGFRTIEVQSNGVKIADPTYAAALASAGLGKLTVSLHSVDPSHSDKITRLPNAFGKTLRAVHNARALGIRTQIAHVITKSNHRELPDTVRFLREEFPAAGGALEICFGIAQPISDLVYTWVMPTFEEVKPFMRIALDYCLEHDIGFGGMIGQGGYPPCMLDGDLRYYEHNLSHIYRSEGQDDFHKAARCNECSFDPWCLGVRRYYVDTYGDSELRPFRADVPAPPKGRPSPPAEGLVQIRQPGGRDQGSGSKPRSPNDVR